MEYLPPDVDVRMATHLFPWLFRSVKLEMHRARACIPESSKRTHLTQTVEPQSHNRSHFHSGAESPSRGEPGYGLVTPCFQHLSSSLSRKTWNLSHSFFAPNRVILSTHGRVLPERRRSSVCNGGVLVSWRWTNRLHFFSRRVLTSSF